MTPNQFHAHGYSLGSAHLPGDRRLQSAGRKQRTGSRLGVTPIYSWRPAHIVVISSVVPRGISRALSRFSHALIRPIRRRKLEMSHKDYKDSGVSRRRVLECMTWAGTGVLWTISGGVPRSLGIIDQSLAAEPSQLTFLQIGDSHVGSDKAANPPCHQHASRDYQEDQGASGRVRQRRCLHFRSWARCPLRAR